MPPGTGGQHTSQHTPGGASVRDAVDSVVRLGTLAVAEDANWITTLPV